MHKKARQEALLVLHFFRHPMNMQRGSKASFIPQKVGLERGDWGPAPGPGTVKLGFSVGMYEDVRRDRAAWTIFL